jgi:hypothetical protein
MDLDRETRISQAALAASKFVKVEVTFIEDELMPELSEWIGICDQVGVIVTAKTKEACESHLEEAVSGSLSMDPIKVYEILSDNGQKLFFL